MVVQLIFFCMPDFKYKCNKNIKAASSVERALAPELTARKTENGQQYAFKVVNIGGICQSHLYVPNFLFPAGGTMSVTEYWHVGVFKPALLSNI